MSFYYGYLRIWSMKGGPPLSRPAFLILSVSCIQHPFVPLIWERTSIEQRSVKN